MRVGEGGGEGDLCERKSLKMLFDATKRRGGKKMLIDWIYRQQLYIIMRLNCSRGKSNYSNLTCDKSAKFKASAQFV